MGRVLEGKVNMKVDNINTRLLSSESQNTWSQEEAGGPIHYNTKQFLSS